MKTPPLLPEETLHRVLRVANFNGMSVLAISGMLALAVASAGDYRGAAIGLLIAAAGAIELHGAGLLRAGEARGTQWLIASQPYLLVVVLGYCGLCLWSYDPAMLREAMTSDLRASLAQVGYSEERFLRMFYVTTYALLGIGTFIYQGAMTLYYFRRRRAVAAALEGEDESPRFN
jgi:hypothetical protein